MKINQETFEIYLKMYEIINRKPNDNKCLITEAAKMMIAAIDEQGNLPEKY